MIGPNKRRIKRLIIFNEWISVILKMGTQIKFRGTKKNHSFCLPKLFRTVQSLWDVPGRNIIKDGFVKPSKLEVPEDLNLGC